MRGEAEEPETAHWGGAGHFLGTCFSTGWAAALGIWLTVGPASLPGTGTGGGGLDDAAATVHLGVWFLMALVPGIAATALRLLRHDRLPPVGWPSWEPGAWLTAWGLPIVWLSSSFLASWSIGAGELQPEILEARDRVLQETGGQLWFFLFYVTVLVPVMLCIVLFAEEYGWRGYLLFLLHRDGAVRAVLTQGALWSLWQLPLVLLQRPYGGASLWLAAPTAFLTLGLLGAVLGVVTLRWGSVWVPALAQAVAIGHIGVWTLFLGLERPILAGPLGLPGIVLAAAFLGWSWRRGWLATPPPPVGGEEDDSPR